VIPKSPAPPIGHVPGKEFVSSGDAFGMKVGLITRVDEINLKADVKILTGGGDRFEIDLTQAMAGPRSFWGGVPEVNSLVIIGYRRKHKQLYEAMILGYIPVGNRSGLRFDPFSPENPSAVASSDKALYDAVYGPMIRYKRLKLQPGDVGGMSASGAELALSKDVRMCNRAGDLIELRDSERTLVMQATHRVEAEAGVHRWSGPTRRGAFWLPGDIFGKDGVTLKTEADRYFGRDDLQNAGPGSPGSATKFANSSGKVLDAFNDANEFPPVTYSNGKRTFYTATEPAVNFEDPKGAADAFTEHRLEMYHTTDASTDVLGEIDGFQMDRRVIFIEQVFGSIVGNDAFSGMGQRQYGRLLKPKIFDAWGQLGPGKFSMEEVPRTPLEGDDESKSTAGAYLMRIRSPLGTTEDDSFAVAVSKQGKLFVNLPGSRIEKYADAAKNVSAEINAEGGIKARIGASSPDNVSLNLRLDGGIVADIGSSSAGQAIKVKYHSSYSAEYLGVPDINDVAYSMSVTGNGEVLCSADWVENILGAKSTTVNGGYNLMADRMQLNAQSGITFNAGEWNALVSGKTQANYAQQVQETIVTGGKLSTILAGGSIQTVTAGAYAINVLGGTTSITSAAGAYAVQVGAGGITMTATAGAVAVSAAAGAISMNAAAGAISLVAGLAVSITSPVLVSLVAPQVLLGGPTAVLGVARGTPMMPPGSPSLDWITGLPLQGAAMVRSI
jgi:hypothetical protein